MNRSVRASLLIGLLAVLAVAGAAVAADRTVTMRDSSYSPASVTIRPGDTVTWVNDGQLPHDASGNGWSTSLLDPGSSDAVTFTTAGTYRYQCTIHADMRGAILVRAAGVALPPTDTETATSRWALLLVAAGASAFVITVARSRRRPATR